MSDISTPHIDQAWRDEFVLAMRLADASGERIGDSLATVDAHCAESGESAEAAFGDPGDYARTLVGSAGGRLRPGFVAGLMVGLVGMLLVPRAVDAWVRGATVEITVGAVVALAVTLGLAGVVMARPTAVLGGLTRMRSTLFALLGMVLVGFLAVAMFALRTPLAEIGWPVALGVGVALLVANVVVSWRDLAPADPVRDPRTAVAAKAPVQWLTALLFPVFTLLLIGLDAAFRALL